MVYFLEKNTFTHLNTLVLQYHNDIPTFCEKYSLSLNHEIISQFIKLIKSLVLKQLSSTQVLKVLAQTYPNIPQTIYSSDFIKFWNDHSRTLFQHFILRQQSERSNRLLDFQLQTAFQASVQKTSSDQESSSDETLQNTPETCLYMSFQVEKPIDSMSNDLSRIESQRIQFDKESAQNMASALDSISASISKLTKELSGE